MISSSPRPLAQSRRQTPRLRRHSSLCDALQRLLDTGAVVSGELVISVADVDLLYLNLNLLLSSVQTVLESQQRPARRDRAWSAQP